MISIYTEKWRITDYSSSDFYNRPPKDFNPNERCLIQEFFDEEQKKPWWLRSSHCLISCPCSKCNPSRLSV